MQTVKLSDGTVVGLMEFLSGVGFFSFLIRIERGIYFVSKLEDQLKIPRGSVKMIERGDYESRGDVLKKLWDYYNSLPVLVNIISILRVRDESSKTLNRLMEDYLADEDIPNPLDVEAR